MCCPKEYGAVALARFKVTPLNLWAPAFNTVSYHIVGSNEIKWPKH